MVFKFLFKRAYLYCNVDRFSVVPKSLSSCVVKRNKLLDIISTMPKEKTHVAAMQIQRQAKKNKKTKYPPVRAKMQILGSGANGAPRSLYISTDQTSYQFNCGEGCQRLANEHKMKLSKLSHIFITHSSWDNMGGLPGMALTLQEMGIPQLSIYGPKSLGNLFSTMGRFVILKHLDITSFDATEKDAFFIDDAMKIDYVPIVGTNNSSNDELTNNNGETGNSPKRVKRDASPASTLPNIAISYICRLHPKPGTLLLEKCVEEGVPPGPLYGQLKAGKDVTLECGKLIRAESVCSPSDPGPIFLVIDCPDESFLENLTINPKINQFRVSTVENGLETPEVVVHFTPNELIKNPQYDEWIKGFPESTCHIMMGTPDEGHQRDLGSIAVHRIQQKLHLLDESIFPLLAKDLPHEDEMPQMMQTSKIVEAKTLLTYNLRPSRGLVYDHVLNVNPKLFEEETMAVSGFPEILKEMKSTIEEKETGLEYPKVIFFGTGSAIPNKTRNTSAILVEVRENKFIVLDCGEGTYGQMVRFFGEKKCRHVLSNLAGVYISHMHADHHIGLIGLLLARQSALQQNNNPADALLLIAPQQMNNWLHSYDFKYEPITSLFTMISPEKLSESEYDQVCFQRVLNAFDLKSMVTTRVEHCKNAFGISLTTLDDFKLTYSGDTMPCENLLKIGHGSHLLIHEATMEDGMEQEAKEKTHSTMSQAIQAGRLMEAEFTLLTHFSQRYSRIPLFNNKLEVNVGVAFDNMVVTPCRLDRLPRFIEPLKLMFVEHYEEMEMKLSKRKLKQERLKLELENNLNL